MLKRLFPQLSMRKMYLIGCFCCQKMSWSHKSFQVAREVQIHLRSFQYLAHEFQNPYDGGGNGGDDQSFHCRPLIALKVVLVVGNNYCPNLNSKRNYMRSWSLDYWMQTLSNQKVYCKQLLSQVQFVHLKKQIIDLMYRKEKCLFYLVPVGFYIPIICFNWHFYFNCYTVFDLQKRYLQQQVKKYSVSQTVCINL